MKKALLLIMALCVGIWAYSQKAHQLTQQQKDRHFTASYKSDISEEVPFNNLVNPTVRAPFVAPNESIIGNTKYDFQTNCSMSGRIYQYSDGTIGAVWTQGFDDVNTFPDRGTGYNYFDGADWGPIPTTRIETVKCGWPNIAPMGENGEVGVSHNGSGGLEFFTRETKGTGPWTEWSYTGPEGVDVTWPRLATSGENNDAMHLIYANFADQVTGQMYYSRSLDGGDTWDPKDIIFDEFGPSYYSGIGGDSYTIVAKGDVIATLIADTWSTDLAMMKSTDNGQTWENTIIWEHPYPFFDWNVTVTDTFFAPEGTVSMAIGPDGKIHIAFAICRVVHDVVGTNYNYWPGAEAIVYWNEDMPTFSSDVNALAPAEWGFEDTELIDDYNRIGWWQDVNGNEQDDRLEEQVLYRTIGWSSWPAMTIDENNNVFMVYTSITETYDNGTNNYRHLWSRGYANNIWGPFTDVTSDIIHIFDECAFPVMSPTSDDNVHLLFQVDNLPGTGLDGNHAYVNNNIYYSAIPKNDMLTGIKHDHNMINDESVSQNYPNPFNGTTTITVNLPKAANLSMKISNILGQQVMDFQRGNVSNGTYYFQVDASKLQDGVYFYTVKADNSEVTKKMIVR